MEAGKGAPYEPARCGRCEIPISRPGQSPPRGEQLTRMGTDCLVPGGPDASVPRGCCRQRRACPGSALLCATCSCRRRRAGSCGRDRRSRLGNLADNGQGPRGWRRWRPASRGAGARVAGTLRRFAHVPFGRPSVLAATWAAGQSAALPSQVGTPRRSGGLCLRSHAGNSSDPRGLRRDRVFCTSCPRLPLR